MSNITYDIIERKINEAIEQVKIVTQPTGLPIHLKRHTELKDETVVRLNRLLELCSDKSSWFYNYADIIKKIVSSFRSELYTLNMEATHITDMLRSANSPMSVKHTVLGIAQNTAQLIQRYSANPYYSDKIRQNLINLIEVCTSSCGDFQSHDPAEVEDFIGYATDVANTILSVEYRATNIVNECAAATVPQLNINAEERVVYTSGEYVRKYILGCITLVNASRGHTPMGRPQGYGFVPSAPDMRLANLHWLYSTIPDNPVDTNSYARQYTIAANIINEVILEIPQAPIRPDYSNF